MMFSRRVTYSERASSSTRVLLSDGMAAKSKLSRLFTAGNRARLWRDQGEAGRGSRASRAVYGWFTAGFDTRDLKEAKGLLEELLL